MSKLSVYCGKCLKKYSRKENWEVFSSKISARGLIERGILQNHEMKKNFFIHKKLILYVTHSAYRVLQLHIAYYVSHNTYRVTSVTRKFDLENPGYQEIEKFYTYGAKAN